MPTKIEYERDDELFKQRRKTKNVSIKVIEEETDDYDTDTITIETTRESDVYDHLLGTPEGETITEKITLSREEFVHIADHYVGL
jgi:hypothetical protein